jgi:Asp-tRNA(Asn)/Glu-tRNA(Gln) amidotransferase A subunit family amidase
MYPSFGGGPAVIPASSAVGQPALSVPNGFGPNHLPMGLQFTGRVCGEARLRPSPTLTRRPPTGTTNGRPLPMGRSRKAEAAHNPWLLQRVAG